MSGSTRLDAGAEHTNTPWIRRRGDLPAAAIALVCMLGLCGCYDDTDTGSGDGADVSDDVDAAASCSNTSARGRCDGSVLSRCVAGVIQSRDCATYFGVPGACVRVSEDYGFECAVETGQTCLFVLDDERPVTAFCADPGAGCVSEADGNACESDVGTCEESDIGTCRGERLVMGCNVGSPTLLDCADFGGTCDDEQCVGLPADARCSEGVLVCGDGLVCDDEQCEAL